MLQRIIGASLATALVLGAPASQATADDFYKGKQIRIVCGSGAGGGYDAIARLLSRHWGNFIAGQPTFIVQNMPGAGSLNAMNHIAQTSTLDGTLIGQVQTHIGVEPVMGVTGPVENAKYDGRKMKWLGSAAKETPLVVLWHTSKIKTFEEAQKSEVLVGSTGAATSDTVYARILNQLAGTKFKLVEGYKNLPELSGAIEKGEVEGRAGWFWSSLLGQKGQWVDQKQVRVLVVVGSQKHPSLPDVPVATDYISDAKKREQLAFSVSWLEMGRPFVAPPGVPDERVALLRKAFMDAINSDGLKAEAGKLRILIEPMSGTDVQNLVEKIYAAPKETVDTVRALMLPQKK